MDTPYNGGYARIGEVNFILKFLKTTQALQNFQVTQISREGLHKSEKCVS